MIKAGDASISGPKRLHLRCSRVHVTGLAAPVYLRR
jgi:hypothetical protein